MVNTNIKLMYALMSRWFFVKVRKNQLLQVFIKCLINNIDFNVYVVVKSYYRIF